MSNLVQVKHRRKGTFIGTVIKDNGDWIDVKVVEGKAKYISMSDAGPGEIITLRKEFCTISEVPDVD